MKKLLLSNIIVLAAIASANSQVVYKDGFTGGTTTTSPTTTSTSGYSATRTNPTSDEMKITRSTGVGAEYGGVSYVLYSNPQYAAAPTNAPLTAPVSMNATNNDSIFVIAKSSASGNTIRVDIQDNSTNKYTSDFGTITNVNPVTTSYSILKYVYTLPKQAYSGSCSPASPCTVDKTKIAVLLMSINNGGTVTGDVTIDYVQIGGTSSAIVVNAAGGGGAPGFVGGTTAVSEAQANISSSKLYPNPTSEIANVELELKSSSDVKVTLTDLMGKEVMTIASGTMSSLNESFSVTNLNKGIYTVNYFINGSAAKAEMLMVK